MKILQIKPKEIFQWDFFAFSSKLETISEQQNSTKETIPKIKNTDFFLSL